jgi:hypothetical protein
VAHRRRLLTLAVGTVVAAAAPLTSGAAISAGWADQTAPGSAHDTSHVLDITAQDNGSTDSFALSTDHLQAGLVQLRLHNTGTVAHQAQLLRLHDGVGPAAFLQAVLATQGGAVLALADAAGGATSVDPGGSQVTWQPLSAGSYVVMCFQDGGDDGAPHFALGMFAAFTVSGAGTSAHPPGHVLGDIDAFSFGFRMPAVVDGHGLYRFTNTATADTHEAAILKLAPGKTAADVLAWIDAGLTGPPPVTGDLGGSGAVAPGGHTWVRLALAPGDYVMVCFVPDDEPPHLPHAALGMVQGFTAR